jgi:hypothetical protein
MKKKKSKRPRLNPLRAYMRFKNASKPKGEIELPDLTDECPELAGVTVMPKMGIY